MPICIVCEADGVLIAAGQWYCINHIQDGFIATARVVSRMLGHDEEEAAMKAADWVQEL